MLPACTYIIGFDIHNGLRTSRDYDFGMIGVNGFILSPFVDNYRLTEMYDVQ